MIRGEERMKKKRIIAIVLTVLMITAGIPAAVMADTGSGQGADPQSRKELEADVSWYDASQKEFHLKTAEELAGLSEISNGIAVDAGGTAIAADDFTGKTIYLDGDILLNDHLSTDQDDTAYSWTPITGAYYIGQGLTTPFNGTLDGQGHTIYNIYAYESATYASSAGLSERGVALIGYSAEGAVVKNLSVTGYLYGNRYVGGIIGKTGSKGESVDPSVGPGTTVINCTNYATITSTGFRGSGGIVGAGWNGSIIENCVNYGTITGLGTDKQGTVGGIAGESEGSITGCANYGSVINRTDTGKANAGGIAGSTAGGSLVEGCANHGSVTGGTAGGVVGWSVCELKNSYNTGAVTSPYAAGGVIGEQSTEDPAAGLYYLEGTANSGIGKLSKGSDTTASKTEEEMKASSFVSLLGSQADGGFFTYKEGSWPLTPGERSDLILTISNAEELAAFAKSVNDGADYTGKTVLLTADIDACSGDSDKVYYSLKDEYYQAESSNYSGTFATPVIDAAASIWSPAGTEEHPFSGDFNGQGHVIRNLYTDGTKANQGLFGVLAPGASVQDVTIGDGVIAGTQNVGAIAGSAEGATILRCTNQAVVFASGGAQPGSAGSSRAGYAGGMVGRAAGSASSPMVVNGCVNEGTILCPNCNKGGRIGGMVGIFDRKEDYGTISECINRGTVRTYQYGGGMVGLQFSPNVTIEGCANLGTVSGASASKSYVGGIAGLCYGSVINSYNRGDIVSTVTGNGGIPTRYAGIVGAAHGSIENCYNTGELKYSYEEGMKTSGPIVGDAQGPDVKNCYALTEGSAVGVTVLSETDMKKAASRLGAAFGDDLNGINDGYPVLRWQNNDTTVQRYTVTVADCDAATITAQAEGGSNAGSSFQAEEGKRVQVSLSNVRSGAVFSSLRVEGADGTQVSVEEVTPGREYRFVMPSYDVTITADFEDESDFGNAYRLTPVIPDGIWTVDVTSPNGVSGDGIRSGALVSVTVTRMSGAYQTGLTGISVDGVSPEDLECVNLTRDSFNQYGMKGTWSFPMPAQDASIHIEAEYQDMIVSLETDNSITLTKTYSREAMTRLAENETIYYSGYDSYPWPVVGIAKKAIRLNALLEDAGIQLSAGDAVRIRCSDGYERTITCEELFGQPRYYFPSISRQGGNLDRGTQQIEPMLVLQGYQSRETGDDSGRSSLAPDQTIDDMPADTLNAYRFVYGQTQEEYDNKQNTIGHMPKYTCGITVVRSGNDSGGDSGNKDHDGGSGDSDNPGGDSVDGGEEDTCPSIAFSDLSRSAWYHEAVDFVLNSKYFQGTSDSTFEPDSTMTRAMFVTVLSRLEGIDGAQYSGSDFTDVETGQWYTAAIQWASQNGIVLGVGEQKFDPEGEVTREQMAAIMYRYAQYKKIDTTKADASKFGSFSDKDSVSDWAVEAMTWATGIGIINGTDTGIEPQANSTRAQVAQIVKNYTEKVS